MRGVGWGMTGILNRRDGNASLLLAYRTVQRLN